MTWEGEQLAVWCDRSATRTREIAADFDSAAAPKSLLRPKNLSTISEIG